jgi:hypothetical protein
MDRLLFRRSGAPHRSALVALAASVLLGGCAGFTPQAGPEPEPGGAYRTLTRPFIALGDTQEHEATEFPLHDNDSAVDAYVEVAQRPPEHPLFGRRTLQWVLEHHPNEPYIHLGDVMDMSCRSELMRIDRFFEKATQNGVILPGNHDGLLFGIFNYRLLEGVLDDDAARWDKACRRGAAQDRQDGKRDAINRRDFVEHYVGLQAQGRHAQAGLQPLPEGSEARISWQNPDPAAFLSALEVRVIPGWRYADSYLAQRLRLPPAEGATRGVVVIGFDTNQAGALVTTMDTLLGRSPGDIGHIHDDQIDAVTPWVREAMAKGDLVVFAGHHNWSLLGVATRVKLGQLMSLLDHPLVYLSAHTHRGFWAQHRTLDLRPVLELNVSSLSDWPIAYRRIAFAYDESARRLQVRGELMPRGDRPTLTDADLLNAWESKTCDRTGLPRELLRALDRELVNRQKSSRGSLFDWILSGVGGLCETCEQPLYDHAQGYLDSMITVLQELQRHLGDKADTLRRLPMPAWCGGADFNGCAAPLLAAEPGAYREHVDLFRRKAEIVDLIVNHLYELQSDEAKAYMTCRAIQAAKLDFELTSDDYNNNRGEAKRRAEQFFRIEASVGMQ